jgi:hypothetical protein
MEDQNNKSQAYPSGNYYAPQVQENLPNATIILVLGILSLVFIFPYISVIGIILGIIAIRMAGRDHILYKANPNQYTLSSFNNLKAGRVCAVIGLSIAIITFVISLLFITGIIPTEKLPFWGMVD